jgi:hypothetical protein
MKDRTFIESCAQRSNKNKYSKAIRKEEKIQYVTNYINLMYYDNA